DKTRPPSPRWSWVGPHTQTIRRNEAPAAETAKSPIIESGNKTWPNSIIRSCRSLAETTATIDVSSPGNLERSPPVTRRNARGASIMNRVNINNSRALRNCRLTLAKPQKYGCLQPGSKAPCKNNYRTAESYKVSPFNAQSFRQSLKTSDSEGCEDSDFQRQTFLSKLQSKTLSSSRLETQFLIPTRRKFHEICDKKEPPKTTPSETTASVGALIEKLGPSFKLLSSPYLFSRSLRLWELVFVWELICRTARQHFTPVIRFQYALPAFYLNRGSEGCKGQVERIGTVTVKFAVQSYRRTTELTEIIPRNCIPLLYWSDATKTAPSKDGSVPRLPRQQTVLFGWNLTFVIGHILSTPERYCLYYLLFPVCSKIDVEGKRVMERLFEETAMLKCPRHHAITFGNAMRECATHRYKDISLYRQRIIARAHSAQRPLSSRDLTRLHIIISGFGMSTASLVPPPPSSTSVAIGGSPQQRHLGSGGPVFHLAGMCPEGEIRQLLMHNTTSSLSTTAYNVKFYFCPVPAVKTLASHFTNWILLSRSLLYVLLLELLIKWLAMLSCYPNFPFIY
ncbi:hypothetical protein J6590_035429, partial [Homalodisca vitripennis]